LVGQIDQGRIPQLGRCALLYFLGALFTGQGQRKAQAYPQIDYATLFHKFVWLILL